MSYSVDVKSTGQVQARAHSDCRMSYSTDVKSTGQVQA
jgi:hypothetical protein